MQGCQRLSKLGGDKPITMVSVQPSINLDFLCTFWKPFVLCGRRNVPLMIGVGLTKETVVKDKRVSRRSPLFIHFNCCCSSPAGYEPLCTGHFYKSAHGFISQFISFNLRRWPILLIYIYRFFQKYAR